LRALAEGGCGGGGGGGGGVVEAAALELGALLLLLLMLLLLLLLQMRDLLFVQYRQHGHALLPRTHRAPKRVRVSFA